jgi:hypothetical protein
MTKHWWKSNDPQVFEEQINKTNEYLKRVKQRQSAGEKLLCFELHKSRSGAKPLKRHLQIFSLIVYFCCIGLLYLYIRHSL